MELLIETVRKQPCLWDMNHPSYGNVSKRDWAWERVAKEAGIADGNEAKYKWVKLRDSHREALRRRKKCPHTMKPWKYEEAMRFLVSPTEDVENVTLFTDDCNNEAIEEDNLETNYESVDYSVTSSSPEPEPESKFSADNIRKKRPRCSQQDELRGEVLGMPNDALSNLFESMCQKVRKLPMHLQLRVQREIFESVLRAEEEALSDPLAGSYTPSSFTSVCGPSSTGEDIKNT